MNNTFEPTEKAVTNWYKIHKTPIANCTKCNEPIYGMEVVTYRVFSSTPKPCPIKCRKCGHLDPAFEVRDYNAPIDHGDTFYPSTTEIKYWWLQKRPYWAIS